MEIKLAATVTAIEEQANKALHRTLGYVANFHDYNRLFRVERTVQGHWSQVSLAVRQRLLA